MNSLQTKEISACIGLGSNLGDSLQILHDGWLRLGQQAGIRLEMLSVPYRSKPVGMKSKHWFINAVGIIRTSLTPETLLERLMAVEKDFQRRREPMNKGHQDRTLDLDLLLYDALILETPRLQIPHPQMHKRLFVLAPLAELTPNLIHPGLQLSIATLRKNLLNDSKAKREQEVSRVTDDRGEPLSWRKKNIPTPASCIDTEK